MGRGREEELSRVMSGRGKQEGRGTVYFGVRGCDGWRRESLSARCSPPVPSHVQQQPLPLQFLLYLYELRSPMLMMEREGREGTREGDSRCDGKIRWPGGMGEATNTDLRRRRWRGASSTYRTTTLSVMVRGNWPSLGSLPGRASCARLCAQNSRSGEGGGGLGITTSGVGIVPSVPLSGVERCRE